MECGATSSGRKEAMLFWVCLNHNGIAFLRTATKDAPTEHFANQIGFSKKIILARISLEGNGVCMHTSLLGWNIMSRSNVI